MIEPAKLPLVSRIIERFGVKTKPAKRVFSSESTIVFKIEEHFKRLNSEEN